MRKLKRIRANSSKKEPEEKKSKTTKNVNANLHEGTLEKLIESDNRGKKSISFYVFFYTLRFKQVSLLTHKRKFSLN